jgi:hypothetical protein
LSWLETLLTRGEEAKQPTEPTKEPSDQPPEHQGPRTVKQVIITIRPPRADGDPGECHVGHYFVENATVFMCDERGRLTGDKERLIGEDAQRVAGRLLRSAFLKRTTESDFNRALEYRPRRGWY